MKSESFSDRYAGILNDIDAALTKENLNVKIAFLLYNDTLFAPIRERLVNQRRFIMLFCPISRDYSESFDGAEEIVGKPYALNANSSPVFQGEFIYRLKEWKKIFGGEIVAFDYHLYYGTRFDISNERAAESIYKDIKAYGALSLNGVIQCGFYRNFFPHGFAFYVDALALLNGSLDYIAVKKEYFQAYFGSFAPTAISYLEKVRDALPVKNYQWYGEIAEYRLALEKPDIDIKALQDLRKESEKMLCAVKKSDFDKKKSFVFYIETVDTLSKLFILKGRNKPKEDMERIFAPLKEKLLKHERFLLPYVSVDHLLQAMQWLICR